MSDIQKAIDEFRHEFLTTTTADNQLKSLLEQVATEAFHAGTEYGANSTCFTTFKEWWKEQNLTFNED